MHTADDAKYSAAAMGLFSIFAARPSTAYGSTSMQRRRRPLDARARIARYRRITHVMEAVEETDQVVCSRVSFLPSRPQMCALRNEGRYRSLARDVNGRLVKIKIMVGAAIEGLGVYAEQSTAKAFGSDPSWSRRSPPPAASAAASTSKR